MIVRVVLNFNEIDIKSVLFRFFPPLLRIVVRVVLDKDEEVVVQL